MSVPSIVALGELIEPARVKRAAQHSYRILSITMRNGLVDQDSKFKKRVASTDLSQYKVVSRNQLVVGFPIDEGVLAFQDSYDEAIVSPAYGIWNLRSPDSVDSRYLQLFLRSPSALNYYTAKLRGTTARRRSLPSSVFLALSVPLPSLNEQRRIAAILDHVDTLRAKRREALAQLEELTQSIFVEMFGDPATNPKQLPVVLLGEMLDSANYGTSEKSGATGEFPVLRMGNITYQGRIDLTDLKYMDLDDAKIDRFTVRTGDILFNRTNSADLVGKAAVHRGSERLAYAGYLVRLRVAAQNSPEYISSFLNSKYGKAILRGMCKSIVGMANINAREVQSIRIPLPAAASQLEFSRRVEQIEMIADQHRLVLAEHDSLFESLQARAFRGEL